MPMFTWTMLIFAGMIVFAFPAVILAALLLELERAFDWPFFITAQGRRRAAVAASVLVFRPSRGLHHLPARGRYGVDDRAGNVRHAAGGVPLRGGADPTELFSFGLWVHHMFMTGIPALSLSFFSAASMAVALRGGFRVFAWIVTIASGRLRLITPSLLVLGFLFIFTLGGLTGAMVAMVPFDWHAHDT